MRMHYFNGVILFIFINLRNIVNGQSHAFIQVDNELKYLVDGVPVSMSEVLNTGEIEQGFENIYDERTISKNYLIFDPPFLDFKEHPTGMPLMKKVFIQNTSPDISIHLHSLSGNTMHFHCTFFQDKVITPGSNTSFDVVFLGREEGFIENTIYVHSSIGIYRYWVKAVGSANPYRVRPLIGVRMPLNSSFTPILHVHNPHSANLQVTEMYSTGGDLHLELTNDVQDADVGHWNIAPYHTKALMKATFVARRENNHTAYIRIVPGEPISDYMVIPIEVEVSGEQGLFFPSDTLHFGLLTPHDPPISVPLYLLNSAPKHIHIQNIITSSVNEAITIDFKPVKIPPGTVHPTKVATVTFDPSKVTSGVKVSGKLLVKSKVSAYKLSVPFSVDLHQGSLHYNSSVTRFYSGSDQIVNLTIESLASSNLGTKTTTKSILGSTTISAATTTLSPVRASTISTATPVPKLNSDPHDLILKNTFKFPVVVHNITVAEEATPHFKVKWDGPVIIRQDESKKVAELSLLSAGSDIRLTIEITVHTNITSINIPLIAYNGKLTKYIPPTGKETWLDFGTLGMGEQHDNYFYILNENPVDIRLKGWGSTLSNSAVELLGIVEGNFSDISRNPNNNTYSSKSLFLKPSHYAVFRIGILTPDNEGIFIAESYVQTQYEVITLPFRLRTAEGLLSIFPDSILLEDTFPGKQSEQDLHILSTFGHSMTVEGISPQAPDPRFSFVTIDSCTPQPILHPGVQSNVGVIVFNPKATCGEECYTGFSLHSKVGLQWASTFPLTSHAIDMDNSLFSVHRERYKKLQFHSFNMSLFLDTSEVKGHKFNAKVSLVWPTFASIQQLKFPLTQVFNTSYKDFKLLNPSSQPMIAQVLFLHDYPSPQSIVTLLEEQLGYKRNISWDDSGNVESLREVFSFLDLDRGSICIEGTHCNLEYANDAHLSNSFALYRRSFESEFKTRIAKDSLVFLLEPHSQVKIRLSFTPLDERNYSSLILIRNNLTVVEAISIQGSGGRGHINFKKTFSKSPSYFHFSIQEKNLKNCSLPSRMSPEQSSLYTLRQTFLAENDGLLPVSIYGLNIGDVPCQSYGFRVINCSSFLLMPNEIRKIEIAFTPDFSLFHVEQHLVVFTSLTGITSQLRNRENMTIHPNGNLYLKLVATISPHAVSKCGEKIPRPPWEPLLYYSIVTILVGMLLGTLVRAFLEAEHILKTSFVPMTTVVPTDEPIPVFDKSKVFDLQTIGLQDSEAIINDSTSDSGNSENSRSNSSFIKIKNHLNSVDHLRKPINNICNSSKTKVRKTYSGPDSYANPDSNNSKNSNCMNNLNNKKSEYNKKGIKMSLGLSSFLSSLPFGLKGNGSTSNTNNSYSSLVTNKNNSSSNNANYLKGRKSSPKEGDQQIFISNPSKLQNEEEFSSTTTESSSVDDLCIYLKDNYLNSYEEKPQKRKTLKASFASNFSDSCFPIKTSQNLDEDTGFEITTKCKGIRKIKETSSKKHSNTIELPYTLKPVKMPDNDEDKEKISNKIKNKQKRLSNEKNSSRIKREEFSNSPELEKRTPARAVIAPSTRPPPSNQPLAPRDPSYSSIVLGSSKQKSKVTPVGKILPEVKRIEKPLGAIGEKLPSSNSVYHSAIKPLMGPSPIVSVSASFSSQDSLHSHSPYINSLPQTSTHVSSHSWDPKTLSSPSIPGLGLEPIQSNLAMSDDDWLPFGGPNFSSFVWGDVDNGLRDKPTPTPPSPSFRDSIPSFNIWSSPWNTDQTPLGSSILSPTRSLWHKDYGQPQSTNSYDIGSRLSHVGNFNSLRSQDLNLSNTDKEKILEDKHA